jgi:hypothetical protein
VTDRPPRVLALVAEADGPALWRIFQPFAALTARGYPAADWDWKDNPLLGDLVATGPSAGWRRCIGRAWQ